MSTTHTAASAPGRFVHPALFYRDEEEYLAGTVPFIREGLAAGEPVIAAVPEVNLRLLQAALGSDADQVRLHDMAEDGRNPGQIIPGVLRAFADHHEGWPVRMIGEPMWAGRSTLEYPACVQHEALINLAFDGSAASILCPYDAGRLDGDVLADAEATHPAVVDEGGERESVAYAPLHVFEHYNQPLPEPERPATFDFDLGRLAQARRFATRFAARLGVMGQRIDELALVVAELTANSVAHGGGGGTLRLWAEGHSLVCDVRDTGCLTDPLTGRRPAPTTQIGGRGLLLVHRLADLVRIHTTRDGTAVRLYLAC